MEMVVVFLLGINCQLYHTHGTKQRRKQCSHAFFIWQGWDMICTEGIAKEPVIDSFFIP